MSTMADHMPRTRVRFDSLDPELGKALDRLSSLPRKDPRRQAARNEVVKQALPLADRLARRFQRRGEPLEDLTQVARLGLVKAADGFDPRRGSDFGSYAIPTILGELKRHFRDKGWLVRVPRRLQETVVEISQAMDPLSQRLKHPPSAEELAEHLGMDTEQVRAGLECAHAYAAISLHTPTEPGRETELADLIGAPDRGLDAVEARQTLRPLLARLPRRERRILTLRYCHDLTQSEIAERVDLSQMHVSRLISRTLTTLRGWLR